VSVVHEGQTFFNESAPDVPRHLWIVLSDEGAPRIALVNLSSVPPYPCSHEPTTFEPEEIAALKYRSYVRCDKARLADAGQLTQAEQGGLIQTSRDADAAVLEKARRAVADCSIVPNELKDLLRQQGLL